MFFPSTGIKFFQGQKYVILPKALFFFVMIFLIVRAVFVNSLETVSKVSKVTSS